MKYFLQFFICHFKAISGVFPALALWLIDLSSSGRNAATGKGSGQGWAKIEQLPEHIPRIIAIFAKTNKN